MNTTTSPTWRNINAASSLEAAQEQAAANKALYPEHDYRAITTPITPAQARYNAERPTEPQYRPQFYVQVLEGKRGMEETTIRPSFRPCAGCGQSPARHNSNLADAIQHLYR